MQTVIMVTVKMENDVYGDCNAIDLVTVRKFGGYCCACGLLL